MNKISISFTRTDQLCVLVIINTHTHLFWSTDKLGIYHVYVKYTVFCMKIIVIEKLFIIKVK